MPYVTGSAATLAELRTGVISALTANGWTLAGSVVYKGGIYISLAVSGNFLQATAGTGIDGSNALTGAAPGVARIGTLSSGTAYIAALVWPLTYEVFIGTSPDEVYVVINYDTDKYQWLAFGKSTIALPGSGVWVSGSLADTSAASGISAQAAASDFLGARTTTNTSATLFCTTTGSPTNRGEYVQHGFGTSTTWSTNAELLHGGRYRAPLDYILPSAWNTETVLLPIQAWSEYYGSSKVALVVDVAHARAVKINNLTPGQTISYGSESWKVYPWYKKDTSSPNGTGGGMAHTGCMGWAIRYDGA